ncbi:hypothetical protein EVAR_42569_1 [Eumeta japonica]|uniref:Uncharacterized protein n=1 Tax=Eumeta variegata TaxID=151549 RepID=A0A4C1WUF7_EUMVA|nr:hypothetical protein EVAR_42569_1 [Eumeta japonica]
MLTELRQRDVEWKICVRYLGVHIDRSLCMIPQVDHVIQQSRATRAKLRPILTSRLPTRTKIAIYNLLYLLPPDLCCTGLVRLMLGAEVSDIESPTKLGTADDRGGWLVYQELHNYQGPAGAIC